jgi:hypothetical protein
MEAAKKQVTAACEERQRQPTTVLNKSEEVVDEFNAAEAAFKRAGLRPGTAEQARYIAANTAYETIFEEALRFARPTR